MKPQVPKGLLHAGFIAYYEALRDDDRVGERIFSVLDIAAETLSMRRIDRGPGSDRKDCDQSRRTSVRKGALVEHIGIYAEDQRGKIASLDIGNGSKVLVSGKTPIV